MEMEEDRLDKDGLGGGEYEAQVQLVWYGGGTSRDGAPAPLRLPLWISPEQRDLPARTVPAENCKHGNSAQLKPNRPRYHGDFGSVGT